MMSDASTPATSPTMSHVTMSMPVLQVGVGALRRNSHATYLVTPVAGGGVAWR